MRPLPAVVRFFLIYCYSPFVFIFLGVYTSSWASFDFTAPLTLFNLVLAAIVIVLHHLRHRAAHLAASIFLGINLCFRLYGMVDQLLEGMRAGATVFQLFAAIRIHLPFLLLTSFFAGAAYRYKAIPLVWAGQEASTADFADSPVEATSLRLLREGLVSLNLLAVFFCAMLLLASVGAPLPGGSTAVVRIVLIACALLWVARLLHRRHRLAWLAELLPIVLLPGYIASNG